MNADAIEIGGRVYACLVTLERTYHVPAGTLRRWAAEDSWPSRKIHGRRYYVLTAVDVSYRARGRRWRDTRRGA